MTPLPPWLDEQETNALANWKCKCGRGPSLEHPVNGHCSARSRIEQLEKALTLAWEALMKIHYATVDPRTTTQHCMDTADEAMRRIEEVGE